MAAHGVFYQRLLDFSIHPSSSAVFAFGAILVLVVQNRKFYVEGGDKPGQWNASDLLSVAV